MKQYLLACLMLLAIGINGATAQGHHRHHQPVTGVTTSVDSLNQGVEAYSDTTSVASAPADSMAEDSGYNAAADDDAYWDDAYSDLVVEEIPSWLRNLGGSVGATAIVIVVIFTVLFFILLPVIIVIMVLRHIIKRHNDKVALAEKAVENGQPIPEELLRVDKQSSEYLWKTGIRHVAIGVGLMVMFGIWGSETLIGIGGLIVCLGIGQLVMAKTSVKNHDELK